VAALDWYDNQGRSYVSTVRLKTDEYTANW